MIMECQYQKIELYMKFSKEIPVGQMGHFTLILHQHHYVN